MKLIALLIFLIFCTQIRGKEEPVGCELTEEIITDILLFNNATGKRANDIGDMYLCNSNISNRFAMMKIIAPPMFLGICGPHNCTLENQTKVEDFIKKQFGLKNVTITWYFPDEQNQIKWDAGNVIMLIISLAIILLVLASTAYDNYLVWRESKKEQIIEKKEESSKSEVTKLTKFLLCFSLKQNWNRLFSKSEQSNLNILNGFRVASMLWVIGGHVQVFRISEPIINAQDIPDIFKKTNLSFVVQAELSVDIFFFLSAFLSAWLLCKELLPKKIKSNFFMIYFHRFQRLLPLYLFITFFAWGIIPLLKSGPIWKTYYDVISINGGCSDYWWTNFLFVNNLVPWSQPAQCFEWTWQLANDMQFFIITPLILLCFVQKKYLAYIVSTVLIVGSYVASFLIAWDNKFTVAQGRGSNQKEEFRLLQIKPYTRIATYLFGVLAAFLYIQHEEESNLPVHEKSKIINFIEKVLHKWFIRYFMYIFGIGLMIIAIFVPNNAQNYPENWSRTGNSLWLTFQRTIFILGFSFLLYPMLRGFGFAGIKLFGNQFWVPLARVTYGAYLIHPIVMAYYVCSTHFSYYWQESDFGLGFLGFVVISYFFAIIVSLIIEAPIQGIEKAFWRDRSKKEERAEKFHFSAMPQEDESLRAVDLK